MVFVAELQLGLLALIWGINFSVIKATLAFVSPLAFNALRFPLAILVLSLAGLGTSRVRPSRPDTVRLIALGFFGNVVYQLLFILGLDNTSAGSGSILLATSPVWTAILAGALKQDRISRLLVAGMLLTVVGVTLVVWGGNRNTLWISQDTLWGNVLILLAAVVWAVYTVAGKGLVDRYGPLRVTAWTLWAGTPGVVALGIPDLLRTDWAAMPVSAVLGVLFAGLGGIGVAYLIWYAAVGVLGSSRTALYSNTVPVVALLTAWVWLGEVPRPLQMLGGVLVVAGVVVARGLSFGRGARLSSRRSPDREANADAVPQETRRR